MARKQIDPSLEKSVLLEVAVRHRPAQRTIRLSGRMPLPNALGARPRRAHWAQRRALWLNFARGNTGKRGTSLEKSILLPRSSFFCVCRLPNLNFPFPHHGSPCNFFFVISVDAPRRALGRNSATFSWRKRRAPACTLQNGPFPKPAFCFLPYEL